MRISDWSSDVCSSDLLDLGDGEARDGAGEFFGKDDAVVGDAGALHAARGPSTSLWLVPLPRWGRICGAGGGGERSIGKLDVRQPIGELRRGLKTIGEAGPDAVAADAAVDRSEEHTSELQALMRISY